MKRLAIATCIVAYALLYGLAAAIDDADEAALRTPNAQQSAGGVQ